MGASVWMADWDAALIVEQPREAVLVREDDFAAMLIGSTLAVALLTTVLAAVVTRRLTRPIVRLTRTAVRIAGGDLDQTVDLARRDEIGILAQAFNVMTAELRSLYNGLEQKVAERTRQLYEANVRLRNQTMQLRLSAEIGRVATSILDIDLLLRRVVQLIVDSYADVYGLSHASILLTDDLGEWVETQASQGDKGSPEMVHARVGDRSPVGQTAADGQLRTQISDADAVEVVVPLRLGPRIIGVLDMCAARSDTLDEVDVQALQSLGDQLSVAIENARIYAAERDAVQRLSRLDHSRLASLGVGARELATELNTIIGFSRLILKGADGPLSDVQRADLTAIYKSGYRLLGLIDNVVTLSELESGAVQPARDSIDLSIVLEEVVGRARQHLGDADLQWQQEGPMPGLLADAALLKQAFLGLVMATAEHAYVGQLTVRAAVSEGEGDQVMVGVGSNGVALLSQEAVRHVLESEPGTDLEEMSVGLSLARKVVELHGGQVWFWFDPERGLSSLTVLPVHAA
jgi:K+-sensing histidine kinase KdpD